jgi:hypothetical protein
MADVTVRDGSEDKAILLRAWQGEVYGVHVYASLAKARGNSTESQKLFELVALEESIRDQLSVVLETLKIPLDTGDVLEGAERDIVQQQSSTWSELLRWMSADAAIALDEYLPLLVADLPSGAVSQVARRVVDHERAIIAFCTKELAGEIDALQDVRSLLNEFEGR